jgi:hypothetical protein
MSRAYASAVLCSTRGRFDPDRLRRLAGTATADRSWTAHVEQAYSCALDFSFNDFYRRSIRVRHVAASRFKAPRLPGEVWCDWTLLEDRRLGTQSLHLAFCFPELRLSLDNPQCVAVEALADFMKDIYWIGEREQHLPGTLAELSRLVCESGRPRRHALGLSRYLYTSIVTDDAGTLDSPGDNVRVNLYRLLFQHARGVDARVAREMLPDAWGSADFFRLYWQPGGIVSLSTPYPSKLRRAHEEWFEPRPPKRARPPDGYPNYDLLSEYPPLRYLAVPMLHFAAGHEETLRAVLEAAFAGFRIRPFWQVRPSVSHLLASNYEGLRLPIVRDPVNRLLERQLQERTANAALERLRMRGERTLLLWAVLAVVVAVLMADYDKSIVHRWLSSEADAQHASAASSARSR